MNVIQRWSAKVDVQKLDKLAPAVFFLILVWLCWRLANLFWWTIAPPQVPMLQAVTLGSQQPMMPNIVRFSLFEERGQNPQAAQQSRLPMNLQGVILATPHALSSAVIRINNQSDNYRIGDKMADTGSVLLDVFWDHVVIRESNGQSRNLKFGEEKAATMNTGSASNQNASGTAHPAAQTQNNNGTLINGAIEQLQKDRDQYLNQMGVSAGKEGFEVTEKTPIALRAKLGLKAGDRIVSVNGQAITSGVNETQLLEQIKKTGQAKIEIQRGDQTMTIQQSF